jgi:hypothetical protein
MTDNAIRAQPLISRVHSIPGAIFDEGWGLNSGYSLWSSMHILAKDAIYRATFDKTSGFAPKHKCNQSRRHGPNC